MKNKWRFFAVTLAVVLCMTVFSVTAYAGGDMVDSTMGDPTMETPTATTQPDDTQHSGWETIDGKRYYYDPETGEMQTGWLVLTNGSISRR